MNLLGALAKVGSLTMVSRILGFVRDTVIARAFGAGMATDAFFVAFKLPNLLRRVFAEGAFAQAFCADFWRNIRKRVRKKRRRRLSAMWRGCCRLSWLSLPRWVFLPRLG